MEVEKVSARAENHIICNSVSCTFSNSGFTNKVLLFRLVTSIWSSCFAVDSISIGTAKIFKLIKILMYFS